MRWTISIIAGGIAEICEQDSYVKVNVQSIWIPYGNTTQLQERGFAIASAALTSLALLQHEPYTVSTELTIFKAPVLAMCL